MKNKMLLVGIFLLALGAGILILVRSESGTSRTVSSTSQTPAGASDSGPPAPSQPKIPAYQQASEVRNLSPTLRPSQFFGKAREAYLVAKEIPQTLAQLPCYCHCDEGLGHKSLHTCFVDDHAAHCAVCVDEALLAYSLQRDQKLSPDQVREKCIDMWSSGHQH